MLIETASQSLSAVLHANPSQYTAVALIHSYLASFISARTIKLLFMRKQELVFGPLFHFLYRNRTSDTSTDIKTK